MNSIVAFIFLGRELKYPRPPCPNLEWKRPKIKVSKCNQCSPLHWHVNYFPLCSTPHLKLSIQSMFTPASWANFSICVLRVIKKKKKAREAPGCLILVTLFVNFKRKDCTCCHVGIVDKAGCYGREMRWSVNHKDFRMHGKAHWKWREQAVERNQNSVTGISPVCFVIVPLGSPCLLGAHSTCNGIY